MSTPDQPRHDEHGRTTGGVRGAINDLLGRGDTNDRPDDDRTDDDRRAESERLAQERSGAGHDAGTGAPTGARFDGQPVDDRTAADPRPAGQAPAGAPTGARFEGKPADEPPTAGAQTAQPPAPTGARFDGQPVDQQQHGGGAGVVGAAAPEQHSVGDRRPEDLRGDPAGGGTPGSARHTDVGPDGPGYAAPAGARTVDVGGRADVDPSASTGPVATDRTAGDRTTGDRTSGDRTADDRTGGHDGPTAAAAGASTTPSGSGAGSVAQTSQGEDSSGRERLMSTDRAASYGSRWDAVKGAFVDEPRKAVADADALVGELLDELQTLFSEQRQGIERSLAADETSTEDMRLALRRYRSFFDRLLSI